MCPCARAVDTTESPDHLVDLYPLDEAGDSLQVPLATINELHVGDAPTIDGEVDPLRADAIGSVSFLLHTNHSDDGEYEYRCLYTISRKTGLARVVVVGGVVEVIHVSRAARLWAEPAAYIFWVLREFFIYLFSLELFPTDRFEPYQLLSKLWTLLPIGVSTAPALIGRRRNCSMSHLNSGSAERLIKR